MRGTTLGEKGITVRHRGGVGLARRRASAVVAVAAAMCLQLPGIAYADTSAPRAKQAKIAPPPLRQLARPRPHTRRGPRADAASVLVQFATPDHAAASRRAGVTIIADRPIDGTDFTELQVPAGTADVAVEELRRTPGVVEVEPNAIIEADGATLVTDPDPYQQNALGISFADHGSDDETLAVVDTGVDATHPDLTGRVLAGYNAISGSSNAADDNGHGTVVAGIAAADRDNGIGSFGVDPSTKILPVKVLDATGTGTVANIAKGITWAVDHGATVINLSLGSPTDSSTLRSAVNYAIARNVVVVAAAGNDGSTTPDYPAAYPGVIAVGAVANDDPVNPMLDDYSNRGSWVSLVARGDDMVGPLPGGHYGIGSGTSFAAPIVAGAATLVLGKYTGMSAADARRRLESTAADF